MKKINLSLAMGLALGVVSASNVARGDEPAVYHSGNPAYSTDLFRENEFSIDLLGTGSIGQENSSGHRLDDDIRLGAGVGANYFFTRNYGVGADAYTEDTHGDFVDSTSFNLIGRYPIHDSGFAPYLFGGATRQFDQERQWAGDVGGGFEFRFDQHWSLFVDARYVIADRTANYGLGRSGLRISF